MEGTGSSGREGGERVPRRRRGTISQALRSPEAGKRAGCRAWAAAPAFRGDVGGGRVRGAANTGNRGGRVLLAETSALPRAD